MSNLLNTSNAADSAVLIHPTRFHVTQREGYRPLDAHIHDLTGTAIGFGQVLVEAECPKIPEERFQYRTMLLKDSFGKSVDWTEIAIQRTGTRIQGTAKLPAGGWYRLEFRQLSNGIVTNTTGLEPIGVGEVFVIAGQSYADGSNDELLRVTEPNGRVVAYDWVKQSWGVAHDPQPNIVQGGTIWPACGDLLVPIARVPVGFVNVAVGGTASRQWLPDTPLYDRLKQAGLLIPRFRAVLWQQGESDVIENVTTEQYVAHLTTIRTSLATAWKFEPPWLMAKSTLHPTVYNKPVEEGRIREAIQRLTKTPGFRPGPDTDILGGENRGGVNSKRHFSPIGQHRAALLWFNAMWNEMNRQVELDTTQPR